LSCVFWAIKRNRGFPSHQIELKLKSPRPTFISLIRCFFDFLRVFQDLEVMICTPSCGSYVQDLWWMCHALGRESSTSLRVTWNKYSSLFGFIVFVFSVSKFPKIDQNLLFIVARVFKCFCHIGFCSWKHQRIRS